jgi:hypothetical protein
LGFTELVSHGSLTRANLEFTCAPTVLALPVIEAVVAASVAGMAECPETPLYIIEIHFVPPFIDSIGHLLHRRNKGSSCGVIIIIKETLFSKKRVYMLISQSRPRQRVKKDCEAKREKQEAGSRKQEARSGKKRNVPHCRQTLNAHCPP